MYDRYVSREDRYRPPQTHVVKQFEVSEICGEDRYHSFYQSPTKVTIVKPKTRRCLLTHQAREIFELILPFLGSGASCFAVHFGTLNRYMHGLALHMFPQLAVNRRVWPIVEEQMRQRVDGAVTRTHTCHSKAPDYQVSDVYYGHIRGVLRRADTVVSIHISQKTGLFMRKMEFVLPKLRFPRLQYLTCYKEQLPLFADSPLLQRENIHLIGKMRRAGNGLITMNYRRKYRHLYGKTRKCPNCQVGSRYDEFKQRQVKTFTMCRACEQIQNRIKIRAQSIEEQVNGQNMGPFGGSDGDRYHWIWPGEVVPFGSYYYWDEKATEFVDEFENRQFINATYIPGKCLMLTPNDEDSVLGSEFVDVPPLTRQDLHGVRVEDLDLVIRVPSQLSSRTFERYCRLKALGFKRLVIEKLNSEGKTVYVIEDFVLPDRGATSIWGDL